MSDRIEALNRALIGRYEIESEAGSGGMAIVYLAKDLRHDRRVALKVLRPELASSVGADRFLREIRLSARLSHPHILTLIDSGQAADTLFLVLPFVEGESLRELIERAGPLPVEGAVAFAEQVASALSYAHESGIVHRDVKPENVLIHGGEAQVSDFGIAVGLEAAQAERLTSSGFTIGSPAYMSPEQADPDAKVDHRSDIYSLGCLTFEMLAGRPPFQATSTQALVAQILTATPPRLDELRDDVPSVIADAVARALSRDPAHRFASADEFAAELRKGLARASVDGTTGWFRHPGAIAATVAVAVIAVWAIGRSMTANVAGLEAVRTVESAIARADWIAAYRGLNALPASVADSTRSRLRGEVTFSGTIRSEPEGARVSWRPLLAPEAPWEALGATPLTTAVPNEQVLLRLEHDGYETRYLWSGAAMGLSGGIRETVWPLRRIGDEPANAVWVPGGTVNPGVLAGGIWQGDARRISDFLLDRYEVTNRAYQEFVDSGGYTRRALWEHDFSADGSRLDFEAAIRRFVDRTGRPGPSTWEIGRYPDGTADLPVTGISWYEAAAYARFVNRDLPTMYHWFRAAFVQRGESVVPVSNLGGPQLTPVGTYPGLTHIGASDMAGNAREWVVNAADRYRLSQGGGWSDPGFSFGLAQPLSPFDRSPENGFRLITDLGDRTTFDAAAAPVAYFERDFDRDSPVSDEVFTVFRALYAYDHTPLDARIEAVDTVDAGIIRQRISFEAAYPGPRMVLYLFLPPGPRAGPLQTIVYFPGSGYLNARPFTEIADQHSFEGLIVRSGRAFAWPVYLSTFERDDDFIYPLQDESNDYRDHVVRWYQDLARSLDYLETRPDLDADRFGYFGWSLGGRMAAIMLALEPRMRVAVLNVAGLSPKPTQPAVDPFNFASRVRVPVLMMSGEFDPIFPLESSALPLYRAFGDVEKEHYISSGAHFVPWPELAQHTLRWLDQQLGPVR